MEAPPAGNNPPNLAHLLGNGSAEGHSPFAGLDEGARVVLHIVPFGAFDPAARVDVSSLDRQSLRPIQATGWDDRYNLDGILSWQSTATYLQVFRNGSIEAVSAYLIHRGTTANELFPLR